MVGSGDLLEGVHEPVGGDEAAVRHRQVELRPYSEHSLRLTVYLPGLGIQTQTGYGPDIFKSDPDSPFLIYWI